MPRYSEQLINEVIAENDIVDFISQYVRLKPNGRDFTGLCPFHKEKTPSFHVNRDKQVFHCFGCGEGGGLMQFVMRIEGLDFVEALKLLADRAGIVLPEDGDIAIDSKKHKLKQRIYEINKLTARFFYDNLTKTEEGKIGLNYLLSRGMTPKTITSFGLGYSPDKFDSLLGYLRKKGYTDDEMAEAGVIVKSNGKVFDRFMGRVMYPIIDLRGNVIGFGGRTLSDKLQANGKKPAKYLNTSNTLVFDKGRNLFNLNLAKKSNETKMILCEGYMDVISVYQAGIHNIVATLGTALTENQAKLLMKYTKEILLCYDSDEAGKKATLRAIDIINSVGGKSRVIEMNGAKDPDEYIKNNGVEMFKSLIDNALSSSEYLVRSAKRSFNLDTEDGKIGYVSKAVDSLKTVKDDIEVDAYISKISRESGISKDAIYAEYRKKATEYKNESKSVLIRPNINVIHESFKVDKTQTFENEIKLLGIAAKNKKLSKLVAGHMPPTDYSSETLRKIAELIYATFDAGSEIDFNRIILSLEEDEIPSASKIFCISEEYSNDENAAMELIVNIKKARIEQMLTGETNPAKIMELIKMRDELGRMLK